MAVCTLAYCLLGEHHGPSNRAGHEHTTTQRLTIFFIHLMILQTDIPNRCLIFAGHHHDDQSLQVYAQGAP